IGGRAGGGGNGRIATGHGVHIWSFLLIMYTYARWSRHSAGGQVRRHLKGDRNRFQGPVPAPKIRYPAPPQPEIPRTRHGGFKPFHRDSALRALPGGTGLLAETRIHQL